LLLFICFFLILIHSGQRSISAQDTAGIFCFKFCFCFCFGVKKVMADKPLQTVWKKALQTKAKPLQAVRTSAYRQFEPCSQFERAPAGSLDSACKQFGQALAGSLNKPLQTAGIMDKPL